MPTASSSVELDSAGLETDQGVAVFGVRHLSPAGAWHLRRFLDERRPAVVLIEGVSDANGLIPDIVRKDSEPPLAILAYTDSLPVRTLVLPLARYSPEYQALKWVDEHRARAEFIDLPSELFLALQDIELERAAKRAREARDETRDEEPAAGAPADIPRESDPDLPSREQKFSFEDSLYHRVAEAAGEPDHDTWWERRFEHNLSRDSYRQTAYRFGLGLRQNEDLAPHWLAENLVREAYMRRRIQETIASGVAPNRIVVIVGSFHASVLGSDHPPMSDEELAALPRRSSKFTLMPYSYYRLSSQSGYGAGNRAPAYFELMWDAFQKHELDELPARYLSQVARELRTAGTFRSTAEVIEAVRLAETLSAGMGGLAPTLRDLHDAATTLLGQGEFLTVRDALQNTDIGSAIGRLPQGVSQTSIQDDFERELLRLRLDKYRTGTKQELALDLRENRHAKSEAAAFLDLERSSFLHRLRILDLGFATLLNTRQQSANWSEKWSVQWTPESEIRLVEAVLMGETVEIAVAFKFETLQKECRSISDAARLIGEAIRCGLPLAMHQSRARLQELAALSAEFPVVAGAAFELNQTVKFGDVRRFDPEPLLPLMEDLFVQGALALFSAANCDAEQAKAVLPAMDELNRVALEHHDRIDEPLWLESLQRLAHADDRNPLLSGYACALLLERNLISNAQLANEVSRRLSPGIAADLGAGWFEGLAQRNRYSLLARQQLWEQIADYVSSLDDEEFKRAVVFLRRALCTFSAHERRQVAENLAEYWGLNKESTSMLLEENLTETEQAQLDELNDFDFGDL